MPCLELNMRAAHSYALVGKHAEQCLNGKGTILAMPLNDVSHHLS